MHRLIWIGVLGAGCYSGTSHPAEPSPPIAAHPIDAHRAPTAPEVAFDTALHFKSGASGRAGDLTFTLRMMPKLITSGPTPEIEQLQIEITRDLDHAVLQVDTRQKRAEWGGIVFELGYADVYHDDIELTVRHAPP